jgi:hypothetical protein
MPGTSVVARHANLATLVTLELGCTSPSYTTLTDSLKLPALPRTTAEDPYGLFTKYLSEEIRIKSSAETPIKLATSGVIPSQPEFTKGNSDVTPSKPEITKDNIKVAKKAMQRAGKYGPEKLLLAQTMPEKQVPFKKDPTDRMQLKSSRQEEAGLQLSAAETAHKTSLEAAVKISV